jgi:hypothetical protein
VEAGSPTAGAALKQAALVSIEDVEISVRIAPGFHAAKLQSATPEIEAAFARHFGRPVRLAIAVGGAPQPPGTEPAPSAQSLAQLERTEREARSRQVKEAARTHPNIQGAAQILGGEIDRTDEL